MFRPTYGAGERRPGTRPVSRRGRTPGLSLAGARLPGSWAVDLNDYKIVTDYSLGVNTGNTFEQDYTDTGVTAFAIAGPGVGGGNFVRTYTAMPVGHDELFVTWFLPDGSSPDVFLMNFKTGIVSDVAPPGPQLSLGTVKIIQYGAQPLP